MAFDTKNIRNVALLGHSGCGKTTFADTMLFEAGEINRRGSVDTGNTVSDYADIEKERKSSLFSALIHANWKDSKINILDTPGFDDFVGEVISSLKVADTGVMMLNATSGVEVGTELIWEYIQSFKTPSIFVINKVDHEKSDFENTLAQAQARFGSGVVALQYPLNEGSGFNKIVDALRMVMYVFPEGGGRPEKQPIPESEMERANAIHNALVEVAAEHEDGLMEKYFEVGTLTEEELTMGLRLAIAHQDFHPVFCCSATENMGSGRVMGFINDICPSPADRPAAELANGEELVCNIEDDTTVFVFKTVTEPRVGLVSYFKVYSGVLKTGDELENKANRGIERFAQLFIANGKTRDKVDELRAGDIGVTVKLKNTHTNNTLAPKSVDRQIEEMHFPESRVRLAIVPPGKAEMEKLIKALHQIEEEDPTLHVENSPTLKQTLIHGQGQLHLDLIKYRIAKVNGVEMAFTRPKISYRETITKSADAMYRHKKQSGGSGQFAEVHLRVEPYYEGMPAPDGLTVRNTEMIDLPWGGQLAFYWCIVGGSIDANYSNAIKKGILEVMEESPMTGSPSQDMRVCIYDGKMHSVDSNDMAFKLATSAAFKDAFHKASPKILEPIFNLEVLCSDECMGDVMGDLQTRRAIIQGMDADGHYQKIMAKVPRAELYGYSAALRSLSQGKAKFHREFAEYAPVAYDIQEKLTNAYATTE